MTENHTSVKRIVDEQDRLLYEERSTVSLDDDTAHEDVERVVQACPSCGSRLDQVGIKGQCWTCERTVCENCHLIARCCSRVLCNDHKHSAVWQDQPLPVCAEHSPIIWQLEADRVNRIRQEQDAKQELACSQEERQRREQAHQHQLALTKEERQLREQVHQQELACSQEQRQWVQIQLQRAKLGQELQLKYNEQLLQAYQQQSNMILQQAKLQWEMSKSVIDIGQKALNNSLGSGLPPLPNLQTQPLPKQRGENQ